MSEVRKMARKEPKAMKTVAKRIGGDLGERMIQILNEENPDMDVNMNEEGLQWG